MKRGRRKGAGKAEPERREIRLDELEGIVERARSTALGAEDYEKLKAAIGTFAYLTRELEAKGVSIKRLRAILFGASTEKTSEVLGGKGAADAEAGGDEPKKKGSGKSSGEAPKNKRKGHGRNGAEKYRGAEKESLPHESLRRGDRCPSCAKGKVYPQAKPAVLVRVTGVAPLRAKVYELERLRCNLCGEVFTAREPPGVGKAKYDESAASMIALLKYGCGLPFNRLEKLQGDLGIPLPAATQWEVVARAAAKLVPAHQELIRRAAQGELLHNDDTTMKILELGSDAWRAESSEKERTGVYTSGIIATGDGHRIALFFTGNRHAGENLSAVLENRAEELSPPIQMCDALSHNTAGELDTILASCMAHARRRFVEIVDNFPDECAHVLEVLREVYKNDATARARGMPPDERLRFHHQESGPAMEELARWMEEQVKQRKVEPNSGLGEAMRYMRKHWEKLTLFLRQPGAPLDNNLCERALKKAILHRKNALFYKTRNGARVGDLFMSLIHTAELERVDPFEYLVALQRHHEDVARSPGEWMPWNYDAGRDRAAAGSDGPA